MSACFSERLFHLSVAPDARIHYGLVNASRLTTDFTFHALGFALEELRRVGAFERSVLIIVTPTGTGWVDPGAINTVEYLHRGDIASVAAQYSYLALHSDGSFEIYDVVGDVFQGALWSGPPFRSETWRSATNQPALFAKPR